MRLFVVIQILLCLSSARFLWGESSPAEEEAIRKLRGKVSNLQRNRDETVRFVRFSKPIVTNEDVSRIKAFKQLDYLAVVTSQVTDAGLESLKHLTKLDTLLLADSGITDATLKTIGQLPKLQRLYLDRTKITDQGLADLTNLTSLQVLSVSDTKITDAGLVHLTSLKNLETIYLCKTQISDNGLLQLAQLSNIKHLFLDQTRLTGTGLKHLALLENLELLSLRGVALNPTALNTSVDLKKLKTLLLNNTGLNKGDLTDISNKVNVTLSPEEDEKLSAFEKFRNNIPLDSVPSHDDGEAASVLQAGLIEPISLRLTQTDIIPDFQRHVIPLLGRLGCNGRSCHGSFQGQGGFSLSMFGYDFGHDHEAITSGENPRIDLVSPDESLVIYKPTHEDDHGGGQRFEIGSWQHQLIYRWIKSGAKGIVDQPHRIISFQVTPSSVTFSSPGETAQLQCVATWENGVQEDVTPLTRFQSNDTAISEVSEDGLITCISPGDTNIISFYDIKVSSTEVMLPVNQKAGADFPHVETPTRIDQLVVNKLSKLGIVPSELCSDEEFLRRVSIDIAGTLPTPEKIEQFLNDTSPNKRQNVIDELIESPAYADWWSIKLADLTGSNSQYLGTTDMNTPAAIQWNQWLRRRVQDNAGWDEIAAGIILSSSRQPGETYEEYAAAQSKFLKGKDPEDFTDPKNSMHYYWFRSNNQLPSDRALSFGYVFMGVRLQCAQCHKHPFDQWSKDDFDKFTQFFTRVKAGIAPDALESQRQLKTKLGVPVKLDTAALRRQMYLRVSKEGLPIPWNEIWIQPPGESPQPGKLLGDQEFDLNNYADPREPLMAWLLRKDNPYFAPAFVNRVWEHYFGVGIVDPPDDFNLANPPSNKHLLEWLSGEFIQQGYDLKWLHRTIANSRTYQLSWRTNDTNHQDVKNFSHALIRRLPAEVTIDAILQSTASTNRLNTWSTDTTGRKITQHPKSIQARGIDYSLLVFGKPLRTTNCDCERQHSPTLLQSLFVKNDHEVNEWLERDDGWLYEIAKKLNQPLTSEISESLVYTPMGTPNRETQEDLGVLIRGAYLRTVSREPTKKEFDRSLMHLTGFDNPVEGLRDLMWVLINTQEFLTNH